MPVFIDGFELDVSVRELHRRSSKITDFEVEEGSDTSDHIRPLPDTLLVQGVVSDTPIGLAADSRSDNGLPSDEALAHFEEIHENREPVLIETPLKVYQSMALEMLEIPRDKDTGAALRFTAMFKKIRIVTNRRSIVRVAAPRAARRRNRGAKPTLLFRAIDFSLRTPGS